MKIMKLLPSRIIKKKGLKIRRYDFCLWSDTFSIRPCMCFKSISLYREPLSMIQTHHLATFYGPISSKSYPNLRWLSINLGNGSRKWSRKSLTKFSYSCLLSRWVVNFDSISNGTAGYNLRVCIPVEKANRKSAWIQILEILNL